MKIKKTIRNFFQRYRYNKVFRKMQLSIARGLADTIDASNALQRNPDIIEELDHWSYYRARKDFVIRQVLKFEWTIANCKELEEYIKSHWGSNFEDILYFLAEEKFNGKVCLRLLYETGEVIWKHPIFIDYQLSSEDEDVAEWFINPPPSSNNQTPKPITKGNYIFSRHLPRDRNLMQGEGLIEVCLALKQDYDEVRSNLRRYLRKMSTAMFKYFYDQMTLDSEESATANQDKIDKLLTILTENNVSVAVPLKMEDGQKVEDLELIQVSGQINEFVEEFNRIKLALEEVITGSDVALGLNNVGSQASVLEYQENTALDVRGIRRKIITIINNQFIPYLVEYADEDFKTTDGKECRFSFSSDVEAEDFRQVEADLKKFNAIIDSNTFITREEWYSLLHVPMPEGLDPSEILKPNEIVPNKQTPFFEGLKDEL